MPDQNNIFPQSPTNYAPSKYAPPVENTDFADTAGSFGFGSSRNQMENTQGQNLAENNQPTILPITNPVVENSTQNPQNLTNNPVNSNPINDKLTLLKSKISQQTQPIQNQNQPFQQTDNSNQINQNFGNVSQNQQPNNNNFVDQSQQTNNPNLSNVANQGFQNTQFQSIRTHQIQTQSQQQFQNPNYPNQGFQNPNQQFNNPLPAEFALGFGNNSQQIQPQNYQQNPYPNQYGQYQEVEPIAQKEIRLNPIQQIIVNFKPFFRKFKIPILIGIGLMIVLVGGLIGFSQINKATVKPAVSQFNNISAIIDGPKSLPQGTPGRWDVKITNNENSALQDLVVDLEFDKDFQTTQFLNYQPINVGKTQFKFNTLEGIGGQNNILISIEGFLNTQVDLETMMSGKISFMPKAFVGTNNPTRKMEIAGFRTKVISPEIKLTIDATSANVQNAGEAEFIIRVKNTKEKDLQDLRLRLIYPSGNTFNYTSSQFVASNTSQNKTNPDNGDDTWLIPRLAGLTEQTLTVKGSVKVKTAQKVAFGVELSMKSNSGYKDLAKAFKDVLVSSQPVAITTTLDKQGGGNFVPGENLKFSIDYINQSQDLLKNVEILGFVDDQSSLLDYDSITFEGGSRAFTNNNQVQWIGNNTPQLVSLAPQARGKLNYSIKVKKNILDPAKNQTEYTIRPQVKIKASNLQDIASSGPLYKMKSNLRFSQSGKAEEIPSQDKTKTNLKRYRITWQVQSEQNEIDGLIVRAFTRLQPSSWQPDSIKVEGTNASNLDYNPSNGEITWKVNKIPAYTGNNDNTPTIKISFELETEVKNNGNIILVEAPTVSARDNFTGEAFNIKGKPTEAKK